MRKPTIAVIRGVREAEGVYYDAFLRVNVKLVVVGKDPNRYQVDLKNVELVKLPISPVLPFLGYSNRSWTKIEKIEDYLGEVDAISIVETYYPMWLEVVEFARKKKIPLITTVFETIPNHPSKYILPYCLVTKKVVNSSRFFIARSKNSLKYLESIGVARDRMEVIYKGVDLKLFKPVKKEGEMIKILFVGRLVIGKGIEDLVDVFGDLIKGGERVELVVAGDGPLRGFVEAKAKILPIKYLGNVAYRFLPKLYQDCDIFCSPNYDVKLLGLVKTTEERFGFTFIEAMASGLPVVSTNCGSAREILGKDNFLVGQRDKEAIFRALRRLIEDKPLRDNIGLKNRERVEELFDIEKQVRREESAILQILR